MNIAQPLIPTICKCFEEKFNVQLSPNEISFQTTRKEFEGDITLVIFPFLKKVQQKPEALAQAIGEYLMQHHQQIARFNVIKGFLNISFAHTVWVETLAQIANTTHYGVLPANGQKVMVEYSSPNTNKPLHLGHMRNIFLGYSVANILKANGYEVMKVNLVNDRGIHICKSMLAYQKFGKGETPQSTGIKGDHLVGNYYVVFDRENKKATAELLATYQKTYPNENPEQLAELAAKNSPLLLEAQEMLRRWEEGDPEIVQLWQTMNNWVYEGFDATYQKMGVDFDKTYYESNTYLLGKAVVEEGLAKGLFFKKEDGSVWVDLTADGLDQKLLLRADGTSVYITQDLGTADMKYADFPMQKSVYVVGNEQDYHFKVLKLILQKLGRSYADGIYHLSYGMVELPTGKMKSREGTVVDADDLIDEMVHIARERTKELGKIDDFESAEAEALYHMLAMGALKYYLLRVDPKKKMLFNPEESIDFQGDTGVYLQYTHAKIAAILRRARELGVDASPAAFSNATQLAPQEIELIQVLAAYPKRVADAAEEYAPSLIAAYAYELAKTYSRLYAELSIFNEPDAALKSLRVALSAQTAKVLKSALQLLGIQAPERM
ncbi:MAG: arginine--tRNA ligase [Cytophagales bacterium]|nr:arginine--tRNA ligase [Bernardetiaceae bacterium]MDW8203683.1 arginine--tRNA ligase [Cytophagales bacterium]